MEKKFDLSKAFAGNPIQTKNGQKAKVICRCGNNKILVQVYSNFAEYRNYQAKYNLDGSRWSPNSPSNDDLIMV